MTVLGTQVGFCDIGDAFNLGTINIVCI